MLRSANRKADRKSSVIRKPRFEPRLEALESRVTPSCAWNPVTKLLIGTGDDYAQFIYQPATGTNIWCNGSQFLGTTTGGNITFDAGPGTTIEVDNSNWANGGTYELTYSRMIVNGNTFLTYGGFPNIDALTFKAGSGVNDVTITGEDHIWYALTPVMTVVGAGVTNVYTDDSADAAMTYQLSQNHEISFMGEEIAAYVYNIDRLTFLTGPGDDNIIIKNTTGPLLDGFYVLAETGAGNDTLTVDASGYSDNLTFAFTNINVSMAWQNFYFYHPELENIVLQSGTGADQIIVGHGGTGGAGIPNLTVDGGGCCGVNTLILDDSAQVGGETYTVSPTQVSSNTDDLMVTYSRIIYWNVKGGSGNDFFHVGTGALINGMGPGYVYGGGGNDSLNVYDNAAPLAESYALYPTGPGAATLLVPSSFFTLWAYESITTYNLFTGPFKDVIDVVNFSGTLPAMSVNLFGSGGSDTLNFDDDFNVNPATYLVASSGTGSGSIVMPSTGFHAGFSTVGVVNLYKSLKPGTVVNKSGYNPAHYVLNIFPIKDVDQEAADSSAGGTPNSVNPPPVPAPPGPPPFDDQPMVRATRNAWGRPLPGLSVPDLFSEQFLDETQCQ